MPILPAAAYPFRLTLEARNRRGGRVQTVEIVREAEGSHWLHYAQQRCPLAAETVAALLGPLKTLDVSCPPPPGGGFDGIDYTLVLGGHFNSLTFAWWTDMVDENWRPLVAVREALYQLCRQHFPAAANEL